MKRVARRGPLARAPGALKGKRGTFPKLLTFLSQLQGGPLEKKQIFEKKVTQCRKTESGTLWGFSTSILSQNIKKLKWGKIFIFGEKSHSAEKN